MKRKINVQVSQKDKSTCNKFHEQKLASNKFYEQKSTYKKFYEQNQFQMEKNQYMSFTKRKINVQQVPRLNISTYLFP